MAVVLAGLVAAGQWLPGWGLRYGLVRALHEVGWPRVSVLSADLSLFDGAVVVRRVQAGVGDQLGRMLGIDGLDLRFRWKPLFSRRVSVERLDLSGVDVEILRQGQQLVVNGLPLAVGGGDGGSPLAWTYDVTALTLSGSRLHFSDGTLAADVEVERLDIQDVRNWEPERPLRYVLVGRLNGARLRVEGTATPFADRPAFAAHLQVEGFDLAAVAPLVRDAGGGAVSGRLDLDLTVSGGAGVPLAVAGTAALDAGRWSDNGTKVAADHLALSLASLRWDGAKVSLAGSLDGRAVRVEDGGVTSTADAARLVAQEGAWDGTGRKLSWRGTLHVDHHRVTAPDIRIEHAALDWSGASRFDFAAQATSFVHAEGRAELAGASLTVGDMGLSAGTVAAEGVFEHARPAGVLPPLAGHMAVEAGQVRVWSPGRDWLTAERVTARALKLAPGTSVGAERLEAETLAVLAQTGKEAFRPRLEARRAVVEHAVLTADGAASAAALTLDQVRARVTRTATGIVGLPSGGDEDGGATALPKLALGKLRVADGRVDFRDRTLAEPVSLRLDGLDLTLEKLDTARPERESPFTATARLGVAQLTAEGRTRPFAATPTGTVTATVRALELPPLSSYVAEAVGVHVQTGQLDAEVAVAARQGKLDGTLHLVLSQLFIAPPDPDAPIAKAADMPVETVLDLLRDSENRIRLSIPVAGDLANPDFDVSDAVGQAVGGALQTAMFTTLKVAFPLAGLISLVIDDSESRRLALEPLAFAPGVATLGEAEHQRLRAVAGLMKDHATVQLTLCGVATQAADGAALAERRRQEEQGLIAKLQRLVARPQEQAAPLSDRDRLLRLAEARAQAAKAFLADSAGIDPGRLFTCRPRVETEAQAIPRVDLVL